MARAPRVSGSELIKRLEQHGYFHVRTTGDHVRLHHRFRPPTTVPLHDVIGPGLLRKIMLDTGVGLDELFSD
jgi:predicted RNA binding protein YcfA (HicA-like mRNA interferase family)